MVGSLETIKNRIQMTVYIAFTAMEIAHVIEYTYILSCV